MYSRWVCGAMRTGRHFVGANMLRLLDRVEGVPLVTFLTTTTMTSEEYLDERLQPG